MSSYYEKFIATEEVKCIDEEIPFEVPQGWEWCRLGSIVSICGGKRIPVGKHLTTNNTGHKYIRVADMKNHSILQDDIHYIQDDVYQMIKKYTISKDDLYITVAGTIGSIGIVPEELDGANLTENADKIVFVLLDKIWLLYALSSEIIQAQIRNVTTKVGQPKLAILRIQNILLPVPPSKEQTRIANKIVSLESPINKYASLQAALDCLNAEIQGKLSKSILQEAIQGKLVAQIENEGTAQDLLEAIKEEKQKLVKEGKLKKSALNDSVIFRGDDNKYYEQIGKKCLDITEQIPFEIPSNWEWCRVRNVSNSYIGLTYKPTDIDEKGTIVLRSCNIRNGKLALDDIVRVSSSISEKLLIEENDIIICARNGSKRLVGKSALIRNLTEPMTFGAFMAICKTPIYEYMFAYLQSDLFFGQLRDVSNTTTINQLTQNKFNDFLIPIPPVKEQERIAFKISQLFHELR